MTGSPRDGLPCLFTSLRHLAHMMVLPWLFFYECWDIFAKFAYFKQRTQHAFFKKKNVISSPKICICLYGEECPDQLMH